MLQAIYLIAFSALAFLALRNLFGNLLTLGLSQRETKRRKPRSIPHPELLDEDGNLTDEPLLVIRSTSLEEARSRLDELYQASEGDD